MHIIVTMLIYLEMMTNMSHQSREHSCKWDAEAITCPNNSS